MKIDYDLLDSGNLKKLERFGTIKIIRPCSQAIWNCAQPQLWHDANAEYRPKQGWISKGKLAPWSIQISPQRKLLLRAQDNGQIGIFPEHDLYLEEIQNNLKKFDSPKILSLFAYTGLASIKLSQTKNEITHVDIAKKCLDWAQENIQQNINDPSLGKIRLINEDAEEFMRKEIRRGKNNHLVLLDPPSFSRISRQKTWDLEEKLPDLVDLIVQLVDPKNFAIYFCSHLQQGYAQTINNLFWDHFKNTAQYKIKELGIEEAGTKRVIPCSDLSVVSMT